jgi:membrane carboxypeptidase/penicillin-binding protein PbpC
MGDDTGYLMHDMLKNGVKSGTSRALNILPYEVAGKTGTVCIKNRNDNTDAISIAYTSKHTIGTWFGNTSLNEEYILPSSNNGGTYATYVIRDLFKEIYKESIPDNISMPKSVSEIMIDINELNDNHIVAVASDRCPERYKIKTLVSNRYLPPIAIDNYDNFEISNFDAKLKNDVVHINFDAKDYIEYKIVRIHDNDEKILDIIKNKNDTISYIDDSVDSNKKYVYKIVGKNPVLHSTRQSKEIVVITPKFKEKYIEELDTKNNNINTNNNWLYSVNF